MERLLHHVWQNLLMTILSLFHLTVLFPRRYSRRDTACSLSVIPSSVLPYSERSACGYNPELGGVETGWVLKPLHDVRITPELVTGPFPQAIRSRLPIQGSTSWEWRRSSYIEVTPWLEGLDSPTPVMSQTRTDCPQARRNDEQPQTLFPRR